ncbi:AAA domain-containing protein [Fimicolochytrium jonesii]|uniref:AAA domain-containing protein n=1 Tax=Fimicolochytrium jonesii TaxID=1396493 RepID=UPI0022FDDF40|nr:AAA domain-containing protein [Fimicolochytrium jonesii]KAI8818612.1 AAA domain-containing protein [Fimicolochytrium jonesii]
MSQIDKLLIRGIRSFDPNVQNVIEFYTPLTIILGHNGAGKTTVIECLKYATTGDLPPNSRNGAFIHDPKLAHETEVKAQIKLRFKNVNQREMVCTRSMSLVQKKTGVTQKTLESLLLTKDPETGESHSLSTKCAELDTEVPLQLGVSKAILESVIFCHQEDTFWPLAEPSILKKKFDDIFASTRYTKALANIKELRKEQLAKLKLAENNVVHLKTDKGRAERVREAFAMVQEKFAKAQQRIESLDGGEIAHAVEQMQSLSKEINKAAELSLAIRQATSEREMRQKRMEEMEENLQQFEESDDELRQLLSEYEKSLHTQQTEMEAIERDISDRKRRLSELQREQNQELTDRGRFEAAQIAYEGKLRELDAEIIRLSNQLSYHGFESGPFSASDTQKFTRDLQQDLEAMKSQYDSVKRDHREKESALRRVVQNDQTQLASIEKSKELTRRERDARRSKINELMQKINSMDTSEAQIAALESKLEEEEAIYKLTQQKHETNDIEAKLQQLTQELREREFALQRAQEEMAALNMQADIRVRLALKKREKERKEDAYNRMLVSSNRYMYAAWCLRIPLQFDGSKT